MIAMNSKDNLQSYLINYTPFSQRRITAEDCLVKAGAGRVVIVNNWDKGALDPCLTSSLERWKTLAILTSDILVYNAISVDSREAISINKLTAQRNQLYEQYQNMLAPRHLAAGEISVCLKHFYALSAIASSEHPYGLISEDDIIENVGCQITLADIVEEADYFSADYIDLAGGCGLTPSQNELRKMPSDGNICMLDIPRTRTSACYLISKRFAATASNLFLPLAMPIDWHIQALLRIHESAKAGWALKSPFLHGSEIGAYPSWRVNV